VKKYFSAAIIAKRNAQMFVQISNARKISKNNYLVAIKLTWIAEIKLKMLSASVNALSSLAVDMSAKESVETAKKLVMVLANRNVGED
jgi:hypothetical protein